MSRKLDIWAIILSASLISGNALSTPENIRRPLEKTKDQTSQVLSGKENMKRLRLEIEKNTTTYQIRKNDTITSIAGSIWIGVDELIDLNTFLDKPLIRRGKNGTNVLVKLNQVIVIPKDIWLFRSHVEKIAEYAQVWKLNRKVTTGKIHEIRMEPIFAASVQSIGLPNILSGFIQSQQISYDPIHPRVVDRSRESQVTCANAMRTLMNQSMNIADLSAREQAFQRKQNVDAWMLPTELMSIGYEQKFGEIIGTMFDPQAIGSTDAIRKEKIGEYREAIKAMNAYLEMNGDFLVGSYVPYYFKRSHYKDVVAEYNRSRKDKHYNTHQSMFAGNTSVQFGAWNVPVVREGKMESFGTNRKTTHIEIWQLQRELAKIQTEKTSMLQKILSLTDPKNNPELAKKLTRSERAIEPLLKGPKGLSDTEKRERRLELLVLVKDWNETKQDSTMSAIQKMIPWYKVTPSDLGYLGSFISHRYELERYLDIFRKSLINGGLNPIDGEIFGVTITGNTLIQQAISQYNNSLHRAEKIRKELASKDALLKNPQEAISAIDFILNFIQSRADFGGSLGDGFRKEIYNGLSIYGDLLRVSVNGKPIDVSRELATYKSDRKKSLIILPEDMIEVSGPMMVDGEKQSTHADISRQKTMNIRTRFFFEFFLSETYLPSELLIPGKKSSYARRDFSYHAGALKIKGVYGLRMKYDEQGNVQRNKHNQTLSENIEEVLMREIVKYENLNPDDPKFQEKLRYYYGLQIKALQMAGFLQDENTLNKSAVNINRAIPYYDPRNISKVHASFIQMKKKETHEENKRLAGIKNFIDIRTLPGDTYRQIFTSISKYVASLSEASEAYPYIQELPRLQDYKKRIFVERFLASASRETEFDARKFLENPKPYKSFILSLESLESILVDVAEITYIPTFQWLSETDQKVIELASSDESYQHMLANILAVESYGDSGSFFSRRNIKKIAKKFWYGSSLWDYQLRISTLFADLENDKVFGASMESLLRTFRNPEVRTFLQSFPADMQSHIQADLKHIENIEKIVSETKWVNIPKKIISDELSSVLRFDEGDGSNVVGKLVSASLLIDKLGLHSEKLDYMLISAGYDLSVIFDDPIIMKQYERTIIRINNLPENQMLLALAENFILRFAEGISGTPVPTETVFNESILSKGKYLGQIKYDKSIFLTHLKNYRHFIEEMESNPKTEFFLRKLNALIEDMSKRPNNTNENIYTFLRDKELRTFLQEIDIDPILIPAEEEWNKDSFRSSVFHYVNKIERLREKKIAQQ